MSSNVMFVKHLNMTLVFESLDKDLIRRDIIKKELVDYEPSITELPDALIINFQNKGQVVYQKNKLSINIPIAGAIVEKSSSEFLSFVSKKFFESIAFDAKSKAYGFNIHGFYSNSEVNYNNDFLLVLFKESATRLSKIIKEEILKISPTFSFAKEEALFNVTLTPKIKDGCSNRLDFQCNIHFNKPVNCEEVLLGFNKYLDYFYYTMKALIEEGV